MPEKGGAFKWSFDPENSRRNPRRRAQSEQPRNGCGLAGKLPISKLRRNVSPAQVVIYPAAQIWFHPPGE
jgi:hypothetical protein